MDPNTQRLLLGAAGSAGSDKTYVDDVFSAHLYTGNGSTQTITNGIDLAGKGGMVWIKSRSATENHFLFDTGRGVNVEINSNTAQANDTLSNSLTAFNNNGFSVGTAATAVNTNNATYASWTFRKAPKFFDVVTFSTDSSGNGSFSHALGQTPGMVIIKRTSGIEAWYVSHRSLTSGNHYLQLNTTQAETNTGIAWLTTTSTTGSITGLFSTSSTYVAYLFAHDTTADGLIQCGSFTKTAAGATTADVNLGWEPQFVLYKPSSAAGDWRIADNMRGVTYSASSQVLKPHTSAAEIGDEALRFTPTGFRIESGGDASTTNIYLAIRRPNKPPTSGTQVYNAIARTGTVGVTTVTGVGFAPDLVINKNRSLTYGGAVVDRLRGAIVQLYTEYTAAEETPTAGNGLTSLNMDGYTTGSGTGGQWNRSTLTYINWIFRRAPGFFDVVCASSTLVDVPHSLGVVPEILIQKRRNNTENWYVAAYSLSTNQYLYLNTTNAAFGGLAGPLTSTTIPVGSSPVGSSTPSVFYLFASLPGISKVFSYTGNGSSQTINCGFTNGARFVLIKRSDSTGNWLVADTARGLVSGNDPVLYLNSTAAEVTNLDWIDPDSTGFTVVQEATANANVNNATYIGLAIA